MDDPRQGIVHVIGPELGIALPGCILACGDSHTSTVGGLGALGIGVGTSEVEHVLATQTLALTRPRTMRITFEGPLPAGVGAKDLILHAIGKLGIAAGQGCAVEYAGEPVRGLTVEQRLTLCNMSIEIGARLGLVAPDDATFAYVRGREFAPTGDALDRAVAAWRSVANRSRHPVRPGIRDRLPRSGAAGYLGHDSARRRGHRPTVPDPSSYCQRAASRACRHCD